MAAHADSGRCEVQKRQSPFLDAYRPSIDANDKIDVSIQYVDRAPNQCYGPGCQMNQLVSEKRHLTGAVFCPPKLVFAPGPGFGNICGYNPVSALTRLFIQRAPLLLFVAIPDRADRQC